MAMKHWDKKINFVPNNSIDKKAQGHKVFLVFLHFTYSMYSKHNSFILFLTLTPIKEGDVK